MKNYIMSLLLSVILLVPNSSYGAQEINASLLADYQTGDILQVENLKQRIEVASITKIMTYLVAMDQVTKDYVKLDDRVVISEKAAQRGGSSYKLKVGQIHSLDKLLESSMVASANDACIAIAEHVSGSEREFIELMNDKAIELKLDKSYFVSVNGYPEDGTHNTMSIEDILKLTKYTIDKYPQIIDITSQKTMVDAERGLEFTNTNPLLGQVEGITGFKTGYADQAGYCLVSTKDTRENTFISIVMGAQNRGIRNNKSLELLDSNILDQFDRKKLLDQDTVIEKSQIPGSANGKVDIYPKQDMYGMIPKGEQVSEEVYIYNYLEFPVEPGQTIGEIEFKYNNNIKSMDLVAREEIKAQGIINTLVMAVKGFVSSVF